MKKKDKIYDSPEYKQIREHLPEILKEMEQKMLRASEELRFEDAAQYSDLIESLKKIADLQKIIKEKAQLQKLYISL